MPTTEQALNAALTEEERWVIDLLATEAEATEVGREHARNQSKIAALLRKLLTRTAEPNAVVLPVEVARRALERLQRDCTNWDNNPMLAGWKGTREQRADVKQFESALSAVAAKGEGDGSTNEA